MPVKHSIKIERNGAGERLDLFCSQKLKDITRSRIKNLIDADAILVNGRPVKAGYKLKESDILDIMIPDPVDTEISPENIPVDIVYQDKDLLVVNKAAGMVVHPGVGNYHGTLVNALLYHVKDLSGIGGVLKPGIVHRLDKDTSGLLIVAKNDRAHVNLAEQIKSKAAKRLYKTIVIGDLHQDEGMLTFPIGRSISDRKKMAVTSIHGKDAVTRYEVLERFGRYTFARMQLHTGRTHQIRVHLSHCGYPVLGDVDYNGRKLPREKLRKDELDLWRKLLKIIDRQALHAYHLEFLHPVTEKVISISSELPSDFKKALETIREFYR